MIALLIVLALVVAVAASPWLGRDSRPLDDGAWSRDALWAHDRATRAAR